MRKIEVCFISEYMYCGGSEKSLLGLLNCLDQEKYNVTLLLMKKKGDLLSQIPAWINVEEIKLPETEKEDLLVGRIYAMKNALKSGRILLGLRKLFRGLKMKMVVHTEAARRGWYYQQIVNIVEKYPKSFDVVVDYMGYGLFNTYYAAYRVDGKVKISWVHFEPESAIPDFYAFRTVLNCFDHIMCVSQEGKNQVIRMMPELEKKCEVFNNIVDRRELRKMGSEFEVERGTQVGILSIGRLDSPKGFDLCIPVFQRLIEDGFDIRWTIIGEGWQRKELEDMISKYGLNNNVFLLGQKINPYPYLKACDIYMQPSRHEAYGIAVAEARAFCKPIIVTDFAGAREQIVDEKTGIIVKCDEESIYQGLKRLVSDEKLRQSFSHNLQNEEDDSIARVRRFNSICSDANNK